MTQQLHRHCVQANPSRVERGNSGKSRSARKSSCQHQTGSVQQRHHLRLGRGKSRGIFFDQTPGVGEGRQFCDNSTSHAWITRANSTGVCGRAKLRRAASACEWQRRAAADHTATGLYPCVAPAEAAGQACRFADARHNPSRKAQGPSYIHDMRRYCRKYGIEYDNRFVWGESSVVPTALERTRMAAVPAVNGWANLWRACGAVRAGNYNNVGCEIRPPGGCESQRAAA